MLFNFLRRNRESKIPGYNSRENQYCHFHDQGFQLGNHKLQDAQSGPATARSPQSSSLAQAAPWSNQGRVDPTTGPWRQPMFIPGSGKLQCAANTNTNKQHSPPRSSAPHSRSDQMLGCRWCRVKPFTCQEGGDERTKTEKLILASHVIVESCFPDLLYWMFLFIPPVGSPVGDKVMPAKIEPRF